MPVYRIDCTRMMRRSTSGPADIIIAGNLAVCIAAKKFERREDEKFGMFMEFDTPEKAVDFFIKSMAKVLPEHGKPMILDGDDFFSGTGMMEIPECKRLDKKKTVCKGWKGGIPCALTIEEFIDTRLFPPDCPYCLFNAAIADPKQKGRSWDIITVDRMRIYVPKKTKKK